MIPGTGLKYFSFSKHVAYDVATPTRLKNCELKFRKNLNFMAKKKNKIKPQKNYPPYDRSHFNYCFVFVVNIAFSCFVCNACYVCNVCKVIGYKFKHPCMHTSIGSSGRK